MGLAASGALVLFEVVADMIGGKLHATIKSEDSEMYPALQATMNMLVKDISVSP